MPAIERKPASADAEAGGRVSATLADGPSAASVPAAPVLFAALVVGRLAVEPVAPAPPEPGRPVGTITGASVA